MENKAKTIDNPNKQEIKNELEKNDPPHAQILSSDAIKHSGKDDNQLHLGQELADGVEAEGDGYVVIDLAPYADGPRA